MASLLPRILSVLVLALLIIGTGCCTVGERKKKKDGPTYICQWSDFEVQQGISIVQGENPKDVPPKELAENGISYRVKRERTMECQAIVPPKGFRGDPHILKRGRPRPKKKRKPPVQYINGNITPPIPKETQSL
jgi:hypothetical protein